MPEPLVISGLGYIHRNEEGLFANCFRPACC